MQSTTVSYGPLHKQTYTRAKSRSMDDIKRYQFEIQANEPTAAAFLALKTGLSKSKIKDAMAKGAVWLTRDKQRRRLRRVTTELRSGDIVECFYDESVLNTAPPQPTLLVDERDYSVWYKPSGLVTQGTDFGDHCALEHLVELHFGRQRQVFLLHRIDREASGLVLMGHNKRMAGALSEMFRDQNVEKKYWIQVLGDIGKLGKRGKIDKSLDDKTAQTEYTVTHYDATANTSIVQVYIKTGRRHQIRRHFNDIGYPVMGDPLYGAGNKNRSGMKLTAWYIHFKHPFSNVEKVYDLSRLKPDALTEYKGSAANNLG